MSATTPALRLEPLASGASLDLRTTLRRLSFRQRAMRMGAVLLRGVNGVVALFLLAGVVDYALTVRHAFRMGLFASIVAGFLTLLVFAAWTLVRRRALIALANEVESAAGKMNNVLVTFAESHESATKLNVEPYMLTRLEAQARRELESLDPSVVVPRRAVVRSAALLLSTLIFLFALRITVPAAFAREVQRIMWLHPDQASAFKSDPGFRNGAGNKNLSIETVHVRVLPPAYSGLGIEDGLGDAPLLVLAGSQVEVDVVVRGRFRPPTLGFGGVTSQLRSIGDGSYGGSFVANASGVFEVRVVGEPDDPPFSLVRAIEIKIDSPPDVRIVSPVSDQLLRAVPSEPVVVRWAANDDLGLADVALKYIRSRGEGDSAQFVSGSVPLASIDRTNPREWHGGALLPVARLGLQSGDTLVFWIEARDRNPFTNNLGRSASLAIAITAPEPVKLNLGDLGPNEIGRFLLSERTIIIRTEALHAKRSRMTRDELLRRSNDIAGEQREFKNSFNEYVKLEGTGGESSDATDTSTESVEQRVREADEERTGIHMHGIPEPPAGSASNVRDMVYAIRAMWDAEAALSTGDTAGALGYEREALTRLKRAQSAVRYVPRVFANSKPIDLKRRYAGELNEIKTRLEKLLRTSESRETTSLRPALAEAYAALADLNGSLDLPANERSNALARARGRAQQSASILTSVGGDHASTIAEALGQLRIVEVELSQLDVSGSEVSYAARLSKPLSLLIKAAANVFAIVDARTTTNGGEANSSLPTDDRRTSDYFRRLTK